MASTNTNTSIETYSTAENVLSTDIYEISEFIENIRANNIDNLDETASMVGIFGYINELFSQSLQNTLIVVSETSNETIPTKAKFSKNIIAHAMSYGITKITATPATMVFMLYLPISYIESNFSSLDITTGKATFIFDKDIPIYINEYEYHADYDIILTRTKLPTGEYQYSAMYDLFENGTTKIKQTNPISNITNPYITTLVKYTIDNTDYVAFSIKMHQVTHVYEEIQVLTNNSIENKTITFTFDDQLAAFDIDIYDNDVITHLTPIYSGLVDIASDKWCNYEYLDENTIRVKFDRDSYIPPMNSTIKVNIKLTQGANANISSYNKNFKTSLICDKRNNYNGMYALVRPLLEGRASGGINKKSIKNLKQIIPREASSRGSVINETDLNNYFNSINDNECRLFFTKKRDNSFDNRLWFSHMLMRKNSYVYPTNTLSVFITQNDFNGNTDTGNNIAIKPGTIFYYYDHGANSDNDYATVVRPDCVPPDDDYNYYTLYNENSDRKRLFEYINPFLITIDDDLVTSFFLTLMNDLKTFKFDSINNDSELQFIATNMNWNRKYFSDEVDINGNQIIYDNKYVMTVSITQNNLNDYGIIKYHMDANNEMQFDDIRIKMFIVLYSDETGNTPFKYLEGELTNYSSGEFIYDFKFTMKTDDLMDMNNKINITGIYNAKPEEYERSDNISDSHGYMNSNTYCKIFILADFGTKVGDILDDGTIVTEDTVSTILYGSDGIGNRTDLEKIIPTRDDIIRAFLRNDAYLMYNNQTLNVCNIIRNHVSPAGEKEWISYVTDYNGTSGTEDTDILRYIRNNINSIFVQDILLKDDSANMVIDSYHYEDLSRYTVCNTFTVDNGLDFYHDYSDIMRSTVNISRIRETTESGDVVYKQVIRSDSKGNTYTEYTPIYKTTESGGAYYNYTLDRIPMIKNGFLDTEEEMQDFIYELEERRKYIQECLYVLEGTIEIDLKFFNTFGPSRRFYHNEPNATSYKATVSVPQTKVYSDTNGTETDIVISKDTTIYIEKIKGQWGRITTPASGWIRLSDTNKVINYIDNVALSMKYAMQTQSSADKYIKDNIIFDIKEYVEDINNINELHIPNIITYITNLYREQLIYFEHLGINQYDVSCQHLYLNEDVSVDITPEFLNICASDDTASPEIDIIAY